MELSELIRDIPDFPHEGIIFKDITPLLKDVRFFKKAIDVLKDHYQDLEIDYVVGIESRGFIIATPLALALNKGFIPIRKPGKLPAEVHSVSYELEYGSNVLEIHKDALDKGDRVLLIDDLLATGGTINAAISLIEGLGAEVISIGFLLELAALEGRKELQDYDVYSIIKD